MATTPEYGEEELVREREHELDAATDPLPPWENIGASEIQELDEEEERLRTARGAQS